MKSRNRNPILITLLAVPVLVFSALAQEPVPPDAPSTPSVGDQQERVSPAPATPQPPDPPADESDVEDPTLGSVERIGSDYTLPAGKAADEIVVILGKVVIEGRVEGDAVSISGQAHIGPAAEIEGDLVVIAGPLQIDSGAVVGGDLVAIAGSVEIPEDFSPGGDLVVMDPLGSSGLVGTWMPWLTGGLLRGRPVMPTLPWVWVFVVVSALIYLGLVLVFERPVRSCSEALAEKPLTTFLVGGLVLLLIGPVTMLLLLSVLGIPVIPLLWIALLLVTLFGKAAAFRWIGLRVLPERSPGDLLEAARSVAIGMALVCLVYMVPFLGFVAFVTIGVLGTGAATTTVVQGLRREHPSPAVPEEDRPQVPAETDAVADHDATGFARRLGAVLIDAILLIACAQLLDLEAAAIFVVVLAYHVVLWGWKTTTIGGIVCHLRVVRIDGAPLQFSDSLVRALSCIISVIPAGLGWFWILWDPRRQAWHDKIAGTSVVRVPANVPLP